MESCFKEKRLGENYHSNEFKNISISSPKPLLHAHQKLKPYSDKNSKIEVTMPQIVRLAAKRQYPV